MEVEAQARALGWAPKEEFKGDPAKWKTAEEYVAFGEQVMPILRENNRRLQGEVDDLKGRLTEATTAIAESKESMQALVAHQTEETLRAVRDSKARLRGAIRAAREANDFSALADLEEQLDDVREAERDAEGKVVKAKAPAPAPAPSAPKLDPEFMSWQRDNPWFNSDKRKTAYMIAEGQIMRADPAFASLVGKAFYDEAASRAEAIINPPTRHAKVDGASGSGSAAPSSGSKDHTYASLPADAKAACDRQAKMLVGPNRAFKTDADWRKHYAEQYFAME